jgi:hypothetical protein
MFSFLNTVIMTYLRGTVVPTEDEICGAYSLTEPIETTKGKISILRKRSCVHARVSAKSNKVNS